VLGSADGDVGGDGWGQWFVVGFMGSHTLVVNGTRIRGHSWNI